MKRKPRPLIMLLLLTWIGALSILSIALRNRIAETSRQLPSFSALAESLMQMHAATALRTATGAVSGEASTQILSQMDRMLHDAGLQAQINSETRQEAGRRNFVITLTGSRQPLAAILTFLQQLSSSTGGAITSLHLNRGQGDANGFAVEVIIAF